MCADSWMARCRNPVSHTLLILIIAAGSGCGGSSSSDDPSGLSAPAIAGDQAPLQRSQTSMSTSIEGLFTEYVISSFDRQLQLGDLHAEGNVEFDKTRGELTFDGTPPYRIQVIGTEDHVAGTWLWGWANTPSGFPAEILRAAEELRAYGEQHGITEFTEASASLDEIDGHTIGLIASGFCNAAAYYRCPDENGALFVLIMDDGLDVSISDDLIRATVVIPQAISAVEINDQRGATAAYFRQCGIPFKHVDGNIIVTGPDPADPLLTAEFDESNWLTSLDGHFLPAEEE